MQFGATSVEPMRDVVSDDIERQSRALTQAGQTIQKLDDELNDAEAKRLYNESHYEVERVANEYTQLQGVEAVKTLQTEGEGEEQITVLDDYNNNKLKAILENGSSQASNGVVKYMYEQMMSTSIKSAQNKMITHSLKQQRNYLENETNERYGRSEGLAVASYYLFQQGGFSSQKDQPFLADAKGLQSVTPMTIKEAFQVSERNPLIGVEGRALLMSSLGKAIENNSEYFIGGRIGGLVDYFDQTYGKSFSADKILYVVLRALSSIWPGRLEMDGMRLGDVWSHTKLGKGSQGYVAFHKLSQWLSYSLIEPLEWAGFKITDLDELTGLAEYRNGGLFLDSGVIELRHLGDLAKQHPPQSDLIIEWRALTVQLLDRIAPIIREKLSLEDFPLAKVLEGGTWWTGRKLASEKRSDSSPPLNIKSDGTVF